MSTARQFDNIVLIMADDLGYWSLGCEGNDEAITPHIDSIASRGVRCDRFFCTSPVCSPARASLLTGCMPSRHGVVDWLRMGNVEDGVDHPIDYLSEFRAYTDDLHDAGYACGLSGKWHLGDSQRPQKSFEHWYVHQYGGGPYYHAPMIRDGKRVVESRYITDCITQDAIGFLRQYGQGERPFYLQVSYTAPHTPWIGNHPAEYLKLYEHCAFASCPVEPRHPWQIDFPLFEGDRRENLKGYFASITAMDAGIGQILSCLQEMDLLGSTLVVFTSDNGFSCGQHGVWGKGNGTYPFNMYESSIRVPFLLMQPGSLPGGKTVSALLSGYDWYPTLLELEGLAFERPDLPGMSFASALRGQADPGLFRREGVYVYDEYGDTRMLRGERWKYIRRYPDGPDELFDLHSDPMEKRNLIAQTDPKQAEALRQTLEAWFARYTSPSADARGAGVMGYGQDLKHTERGFAPGSFAQSE